MLVPIVCFTCGCPIGDKEDLYNYMKAAKIRENLNKDPENLDCSEILKILDITNDCCKMHFISSMIFTDYY